MKLACRYAWKSMHVTSVKHCKTPEDPGQRYKTTRPTDTFYGMTNTFSRPQSQEPVSVNEWILEAKAEADVLKDRRDAEQKVKVAEWVKKAKDITVKQNKDGIAYIGVRSDAAGTEKEIEVLLDDDDWRKFMGATANVQPCSCLSTTGARIFVQLPEVQMDRTLARRARANSWEYAGTRNAGEPRILVNKYRTFTRFKVIKFVYGTYRDSGCKGALLVKRELGESDQNARNGLDPSSTLEEDSSMTLRWANSAVGGMTAVAPGESTPMKDKIVAKATKEEMRAMNAMGRCLPRALNFSFSTPQHGHGHGHHHGHCHHQRHHHGHNWDHRHHRDIAGDNTEFMKRVDIEARDYRYKGDMKG
ncbi:hypothetical protein NDA14_001959 [Ustilago hordei]|nr:hypothetical protein NDA14_001959 [Ustilago hordei]